MTLRLYVIHDRYPGSHFPPDEAHWDAIWADDQLAAFNVYRRGHPDPQNLTLAGVVFVDQKPPEGPDPTEGDKPHSERRLEFLREIGWRLPGETECERCYLYPFGMSEYGLCDDCGICRECGCECWLEEEESV